MERVRNKTSESISLAVIISYLSFFASLLSTLFFVPFLVEKVGDDYGVYGIVQSITTWLTTLSTAISASFVHFAVKEKKDTGGLEHRKSNTVFLLFLSFIAICSLIVGIVLFVLFRYQIIRIETLSEDQFGLFTWILLLSVFHTSLSVAFTFFHSYVLAKKKFVVIRAVTLSYSILYPILSYIFLSIRPSMFLVVVIMFLIMNLGDIFIIFYSFKKLKISFEKIRKGVVKSLFKPIIAFSLFILINTIIDSFNSSIDKLLLGFMCGASFATIYQLGMSFRTYLTSLSLVVSNNFIPQINQFATEGDIKSVNSLFFRVGTIQSVIIWLIIGGFASCGFEFINWWIGPEKSFVFVIGLALMINGSFPLCENISIEYQRAMNKHRFRAFLYVICMLLNLGLTFCLIKFVPAINPLISCLIGTLVSDFIGRWVIINIYNEKVLRLNVIKLFASFFIIFVLSAVSCGLTYLFQNLFFKGTSVLYIFLTKGIMFVLFFALLLFITFMIIKRINPEFALSLIPAKARKTLGKIQSIFTPSDVVQKQKKTPRLYALDALRFLMALIVFLDHLNIFTNLNGSNFFELYFRNPIFAVDFFFLLSGVGQVLKTYKNDELRYPSFGEALKQGLRKAGKLYLVYLVALIFAIPAFVLIRIDSEPAYMFVNVSSKLAIYLTMLQSMSGKFVIMQNVNGVGWYISCLVVIEVFAPYVGIFLRKHVSKSNSFSWLLGMVLLTAISYLCFKLIEKNTFFDYLAYGSPYSRILYVAIGMIIGIIFMIYKEEKYFNRICGFVLPISFLMFIAWFLFRNTINNEISLFSERLSWFVIPLIDLLLVSLFVICFTANTRLSRFLGCKFFKFTASISLPFYLFHTGIITIINFAFEEVMDTSFLNNWCFRICEAFIILVMAIGLSVIYSLIIKKIKSDKNHIAAAIL